MPAGDTPTTATAAAAAKDKSSTQNPLIVDLGRKPRKQIKRLRKGRGKLFAKVTDTLQELKTASTISSNAEPVVVIVREKRRTPKRRRGGLLPRC